MAEAFKTTFEVFPRVGPDNSLEGLTERSVGLIAHRPGNVDVCDKEELIDKINHH